MEEKHTLNVQIVLTFKFRIFPSPKALALFNRQRTMTEKVYKTDFKNIKMPRVIYEQT